MKANDNTVNIKKRSYHHGELRAALISEGLRLLANRDVEALSLREVARGAGVSATSVYRHFPDKDALMTALALEGLTQLGAAQHNAAAAAGGGNAGFAATGRAYIRFALGNPALFRLIFASPVLSGREDASAEPDAMIFLRANAAEATKTGVDHPVASVRAVKAWALVHGLAMLMLDGQIPADEALIDKAVTAENAT